MKNLFDDPVNREIADRIDKISPDSNAAWGKMNAGQMLAHCSVGLSSALGDTKQKRSFIGLLFGKIAKKQIFSDKPLKQGLPTDKMFIINDDRNIDDEKKKIKSLLERFTKAGPGGMTKGPHPFFGVMTPDEWGILQYKHIDHHLRQFGK